MPGSRTVFPLCQLCHADDDNRVAVRLTTMRHGGSARSSLLHECRMATNKPVYIYFELQKLWCAILGLNQLEHTF